MGRLLCTDIRHSRCLWLSCDAALRKKLGRPCTVGQRLLTPTPPGPKMRMGNVPINTLLFCEWQRS